MCACSITGEENVNPLQYSCLENPMDREAWWAAVRRVAQSQTRLKQLSSSSMLSHSVISSSLWPMDCSLPDSRFLCSWNSPGKNTGVGSHFLLQCRTAKSERSRSVVSDSLQPHGLQPTRFLHPQDKPFPFPKGKWPCHNQFIFLPSIPSLLPLPSAYRSFSFNLLSWILLNTVHIAVKISFILLKI